MHINKKPISVNFTQGRGGDSIKKIVLHTTVGYGSPFNWFNNPSAQSSAHYWVGINGNVEQYVEDSDTAWHSGDGYINLQSIGIEHDDRGVPYDSIRTDALYESSAQLVADICKRYNVPCQLVDGQDKWTWGINRHKEFAATECPAGLDVDRIIKRANEILNPIPEPDPEPDLDPNELDKLKEKVSILEKQIEELKVLMDETQKKLIETEIINKELLTKVANQRQEIGILTLKKQELTNLLTENVSKYSWSVIILGIITKIRGNKRIGTE